MNSIKTLGPIVGSQSFRNGVICSFDKTKSYEEITVYFGGDVQSYPEVMSSYRDHGKYFQWNLLNMASLLSLKFPLSAIFVILPNRFEMKTFSCFDGFVPSGKLGEPTHSPMFGAVRHLKMLLQNTLQVLTTTEECIQVSDLEGSTKPVNDNVQDFCSLISSSEILLEAVDKINIIGFSKGCVVLNQLIREIHTMKTTPLPEYAPLESFWNKVKSLYWLDGGHAGGHDTWVTDTSVLSTLASLPDLHIHIHVTPYQIHDELRPWIGKECKEFWSTLKKEQARVSYKIHFEDSPASIDKHFAVLASFR